MVSQRTAGEVRLWHEAEVNPILLIERHQRVSVRDSVDPGGSLPMAGERAFLLAEKFLIFY